MSASFFHSFQDDDSSAESDTAAESEEKHAVVCMGRQPNSDVYVLGPNLQFWSDGTLIPCTDQKYVWIDYLLKKLKLLNYVNPLKELPVQRRPLHYAVKGLKKLCGQNALSAIHILGEFDLYLQKRCLLTHLI